MMHMLYCRDLLKERYDRLASMEDDIRVMDEDDRRPFEEERKSLAFVRGLRMKDFEASAKRFEYKYVPQDAKGIVEEFLRLRTYQEKYELDEHGRFHCHDTA